MSIVIETLLDPDLDGYQSIPISFTVSRIFSPVVPAANQTGLVYQLQPVAVPWYKEYDHPGNQPSDWGKLWDLTHWGFIIARSGEKLLGGCALAWRTPGLDMLEGRDDLVVLWDLRVVPDYRGQGIGSRLFVAAVEWARDRGAVGLKIETQNINAGACRFYAAQGCRLAAINTRAYPELPGETQFIWYKDLLEIRG